MDRPARAIARKLRHVEHLGHDPLPDKRRIPVDQERHDFFPFRRVPERALTRPRLALDHRVHRLEVRRVGEQRQVHALAAGRRAVVRGPQVVLDVSRAVPGAVVLVAFCFFGGV